MIYIILGTKAQLIKMGPIMKELQLRKINYIFVHTGQHKETMNDLIRNFGIKKPDVYLYSGQDITKITQVIPWMLKILFNTIKYRGQIFSQKGIVLVHGDTFSTILGALVGKLNGLKIGHVESGLRSHNIFNPFPEEITRLATFALTDIYFCPNNWAVSNLRNYRGQKVNCKVNTIYDSIKCAAENKNEIRIPKTPYIICSIHRFENIFNRARLRDITRIISDVSKKYKVMFILHPPTLRKLKKYGFYSQLKNHENVDLRNRFDFFTFNKLLLKSEFVITDGGSNQEECYYLGKPCLILRMQTERTEGLGKNAVLSRFEDAKINEFITNYKHYRNPHALNFPSSAKIIVNTISVYK